MAVGESRRRVRTRSDQSLTLAELRARYQEIEHLVPKPEELERLVEAALAVALSELVAIVADRELDPTVRVQAASTIAGYGRLVTMRRMAEEQAAIERAKLAGRSGVKIVVLDHNGTGNSAATEAVGSLEPRREG